MKRLSIVIPCYNAKEYISLCLQSLEAQTIAMDNLEIILVNDASTDDTLPMLYEWEKRYPQSILVVNCAENGKQGRARNIGLTYATSEYVGFMDNDDIAEPSMYEKLLEKAELYECDLVVCKNKSHTMEQITDITMGRSQLEDTHLIIRNESERAIFLEMDINQAIWNKLYKKAIMDENNLYFPEGYIYDDIFFSELVKHYVRDVYILEEFLYHHIKRANASSHDTTNIQNRLGYIEVQILKIKELKKRGLYYPYQARYEKEYLIDYIAFLQNLLKTYSHIPPSLLMECRNQTLELFPSYKSNPLVMKILGGAQDTFHKAVCEGLLMETMNEEYVNRLTTLANPSLPFL